jgi:hypothetical protein
MTTVKKCPEVIEIVFEENALIGKLLDKEWSVTQEVPA